MAQEGDEKPVDQVLVQWNGTEWVELGSAAHEREQRLKDFLWDHAGLHFGEEESFTNSSYSATESDCAYCGRRKHFNRRDAWAVKEIHKRANFSELRELHPHLTLDYLEELLTAVKDEGESGSLSSDCP